MTKRDIQFLKAIGVEPIIPDDPVPSPLPAALPPGPLFPSLTVRDANWLLSFGVMWEQEPEPGFTPPDNLREYLARYPNGVREAVAQSARELRIALPEDVEALAQDVTEMFLDFCTDLEDIVERYRSQPPTPCGECRSEHFHRYIRRRLKAGLLTLLRMRKADGC